MSSCSGDAIVFHMLEGLLLLQLEKPIPSARFTQLSGSLSAAGFWTPFSDGTGIHGVYLDKSRGYTQLPRT